MRSLRPLLPLLLAHALPAQQAAPPSASDSPFFLKQEITVTATRSEVEPSRAPVSATTVSAREIALRNVQVADRALETLPGVYVSRGKGYQDTLAGVGLRGFSGRGAGQSRTLVLLDGQPLNDPYSAEVAWTSIPVDEVERVEVVRGPFSALYGSNAMGGVIQILTRPVDRRLEMRGEYGSQDTFRYGARLADRLRDRLGLSASYERLQSGGYPSGYVTSAGTTGTEGTPVTGFIPTLTPSGSPTFIIGHSGNNAWEQTTWRLRGDYTFARSTMLALQYLRRASWYGYDAYATYLRTQDGRPFDSGIALIAADGIRRRLTVTPSLFLAGDGGTRSHLVSAKLFHALAPNNRLRLGAGLIRTPLSYYSTPAATATLAGGPGTISDRPARAWFSDAQWNLEAGATHAFTAGVDLRRDASAAVETAVPDFTRRIPGASVGYWARGKTFTQGIYVQHQWRPGERLAAVGGARYDYWRTYEGGVRMTEASAPIAYHRRSNHAATAKVAVLYRAPGNVALRAGAGNAYRNPTIYELYRTWRSSAGTIFASNPDLKPEKLTAWELGANRRWQEGFELDAAYFDNRVRDLVYRSTDFSRDPQGRYRPVVNAARAHSHGLECSLRAPLSSWLYLRASYTRTLAEITANPAVPATVGKRIPYVPEHTGGLNLFLVRRRWGASFSGRYVSAVFSTDTNTDTTKGVPGAFDPFFVADASFTFDLTSRVSLYASVDNVFDRVYYSLHPVPGRMVFAGLRFRLSRD